MRPSICRPTAFFKLLFVACCSVCTVAIQAQDTLAFRFQLGLIVLPGSLNGVPTDFVFDTGSPITITTSSNNQQAGINPKKRSRVAIDANDKAKLVPEVAIDAIQFGSHRFGNIKGITADMPALACNKQVLLGQDVIMQRNWLFDFERMHVIISKDSFGVKSNGTLWAYQLKGGKPHISFSMAKDTTVDCLIDLGFTGISDAGPLSQPAKNILQQKRINQSVVQMIRRSMGLHGYGSAELEDYFVVDTVYLQGKPFSGFLAAADAKSRPKLGAAFFSNTCTQLILHNNRKTYELIWKPNAMLQKWLPDVAIGYNKGQLFVSEKNISVHSTSHDLQVGEVITAVNGKRATDFADECAFLNWWYGNKFRRYEIEKANGKRLVVEGTMLTTKSNWEK